MGILFIHVCSCIAWILGSSVYVHIKTVFNFSYLVPIYPVDVFHFTQWYSQFFLYKLQGEICE